MSWLQHMGALAVALEARAERWLCYLQCETEPLVRHPVERDHSVPGSFSSRKMLASTKKVRLTFVADPTLEGCENVPEKFFHSGQENLSPRSAWLIPFFPLDGFASSQNSPLLRWSFSDSLEVEGLLDSSNATVQTHGTLFSDLSSFEVIKSVISSFTYGFDSRPAESGGSSKSQQFHASPGENHESQNQLWHRAESGGSISKMIQNWQRGMRDGEYYLANATSRMNGPARDSAQISLSAFVQEWLASPVRHGVYINCGEQLPRVCCFSPERFVLRSGKRIQTEPIKGTVHFESGGELNAVQALWNSEKEMSEQTMVTDLLRNDFNKICRPGSVVVSSPFEIRAAGNLLQMQSVVEGELENGSLSHAQVLSSLLPAGSVTGTPKWVVSRKIETSEAAPRGYYTGVFALSRSLQEFDSTVLIRGFFADEKKWYAGIGAGITTLSDSESEVREFELKWQSFANRWSRLTDSRFHRDSPKELNP
ncbi:hypothetical protein EBR21_09150 [bacterium]|nr:hypothetical protein [bacterium]